MGTAIFPKSEAWGSCSCGNMFWLLGMMFQPRCSLMRSAQVKIGTDVAASEFYTAEKKHYDLDFKNPSSPADTCLQGAAVRTQLFADAPAI
eukprot:Skav217360  [mRNA]  locus=scaffold4442:126068:126340:+ [translate_table: standard]